MKAQNLRIPDQIKAAERRLLVVKAKEAGYSYREIARMVKEHFNELYGEEWLPKGYDERFAYKDLQRELERHRVQFKEPVAQIRDVELQRIERMINVLWPRAMGRASRGRFGEPNYDPGIPPDYGAHDRIIKLMERRAKYLGLDEAEKIDLMMHGPTKVKLVYGIDPAHMLNPPEGLDLSPEPIEEADFEVVEKEIAGFIDGAK